MKSDFYMNKANFLLEKMEEESPRQVIELDMWSWNFEKGPYTLYTVTDGQGNYPLSNDGSVFFTEYEDSLNNLDLDGKPHSKGNRLFVFERDNIFGIFDENLVLKYGTFKNQNEALEEIHSLIENREVQTYDDELFLARR